MTRGQVQLAFTLVLLAASALGIAIYAAEKPIPNINQRGDSEEKFAERVGIAVLEAARSSPKNPKMLKFTPMSPVEGRVIWKIKLEYYGTITGKKFEAEVTVKIDTIQKDKWEISNVEYTDNNDVSFGRPNQEKIQKLIKAMNGK